MQNELMKKSFKIDENISKLMAINLEALTLERTHAQTLIKAIKKNRNKNYHKHMLIEVQRQT